MARKIKYLDDMLVSGSDAGTVRIWDAQSGGELQRLTGHEGGVFSVGFSPDGTRIVSGSDDRTVQIKNIEAQMSPNILELACDRFANFSMEALGEETGLRIENICTSRHRAILLQ